MTEKTIQKSYVEFRNFYEEKDYKEAARVLSKNDDLKYALNREQIMNMMNFFLEGIKTDNSDLMKLIKNVNDDFKQNN